MDYEKLHKDTITKLQEMVNSGKITVETACGICADFVPESEDERMIQYFKDLAPFDKADELYEKYGFSHKDAIAWLEKQSEHANFRNKIQIGDKVTRNKDGVLVNLTQLNRVAKKQGEHKPADKVEPKFHKGDWVVYCNEDVDLIIGIDENGYHINNGGYIPFICASDVRLWTLQDAKDGDVLREDSCTFIFKERVKDDTAVIYCVLFDDWDFEIGQTLHFDTESTTPATKEQRDLLFQKMKEAGYEWDSEKKELKKEKVDNLYNYLYGKQKPAWSEEDERNLQGIIDEIEANKNHAPDYDVATYDRYLSFLEFLKDRYTWKPSDEQMKAIDTAVSQVWTKQDSEKLMSLYKDLKKLREE